MECLPPRPELLLSATLLLLTEFANRKASPEQVRAMCQHLTMLAGHAEVAPMVRETCHSLARGLAGQGPAAGMAMRNPPNPGAGDPIH